MKKKRNNKIEKVWKISALVIITLFIFLKIGNVTNVQTKTIRLNYSWINMTEGYSMKLKVRGTKKKVKWSSSNKKVVTVNKKGKVSGKKAGKATITAKVGKKKLKCRVTVTKIPKKKETTVSYTDVTFNVAEVHINLYDVTYSKNGYSKLSESENATFELELLNNTKSIKWTSSDEKVATVKSGMVTAQSKGNCTIIAEAGGKKYVCPVTVTNYSDVETVYNQRNIYIMLSLINKDRVKVKVAPLLLKSEITKVADLRAEEAAKLFSHTRPDGSSYKTAYDSMGLKVGRAIGENLSYNLDSVKNRKKIVNAAYKNLYASAGHRQNMLNKDFTYIGISSYTKEYKNEWGYSCAETYFAQEFYTK